MGLKSVSRAPSNRDDNPDAGDSVTDLGQPALVRATALEIARGSVLAGRYQVEAVIGRGGSGIVLRAFDRVTQVPVAIKILKPDLAADPHWVERFSRELRLARQIQHPHVCRVFDIGQADGHWFITMELASGGTLRDQLGENAKSRPLEERLADVRAVVAGLAVIHEAGIVHRDVKPDNFLRMADGRLVLTDFGLATNPSDAPVVSIMVGTPYYMAPEVVIGEAASVRSDVWATGVVIHEIFSGTRPDRRSPQCEDALKAATTPIERAVLQLCATCLADEPEDRPESGRDVQRRLEESVDPSLRRSARNAKARWAWPAAAVGAALVGTLLTGHLWNRASAGSASQTSRPPTTLRGTAADWSKAMNVVASFHEKVHCMSWATPDRTLELVLGAPRRALDVDVKSGTQTPASLAEATFAIGCPQRSSEGELLYERLDGNGRHEIMLQSLEGTPASARPMTTGSDPVWLPSGREFVYTADDAHAAIFSVPVMTTSILPGAAEDGGLLVEKVVARDGRSMALRYLDRNFRRRVVVHDLPSLSILSSTAFEEMLADLSFGQDHDGLLFTVADVNGRILASLDLRSGTAVRLGGLPGRNVAMPRWGTDRVAVVSSLFKSDVWKYENGQRTQRLTNDGQSYYPDLSARGDLIVQHPDLDGRASIRLFRGNDETKTLTTGPRDLTPRFLPDGTGFLYVDSVRQAIRKCALDGACNDVLTTTDVPFFPVASPDQRYIAYLTVLGRNRLKILDAQRSLRDLGPARPDCPPRWSSPARVWALQGTDQAPAWTEYNADTGEQLRTLPLTESPRSGTFECPFLSSPPGALNAPSVAAWTSEDTEIGIFSSDQQGWYGQNP
jgi:serine/threonine protein kinase